MSALCKSGLYADLPICLWSVNHTSSYDLLEIETIIRHITNHDSLIESCFAILSGIISESDTAVPKRSIGERIAYKR